MPLIGHRDPGPPTWRAMHPASGEDTTGTKKNQAVPRPANPANRMMNRESAAVPLDTRIDVVTPENVAFRYTVAGPFRRLPAFIIDLMIRAVLMGTAAVILSVLAIGIGATSLFGGILVAWFALEWFYGGLFEALWNGQTPGKRLCGLRVLSVDGRAVNGVQAVLRNILRTVDILPVVPVFPFEFGAQDVAMPVFPLFLVSVVSCACTRRFQRLGDLACGTMVVVEERKSVTAVAAIRTPEIQALARSLPPGFTVPASVYRPLNHYLQRRAFFSPARRREIARPLATALARRWGLPTVKDEDLLLCAVYIRSQADELVPVPTAVRAPGTPPSKAAANVGV